MAVMHLNAGAIKCKTKKKSRAKRGELRNRTHRARRRCPPDEEETQDIKERDCIC